MECLTPYYIQERDLSVPCGKCPFCLATRRQDWVLRLSLEHKWSKASKFVTLTYSDRTLYSRKGKGQLVTQHLQKFFKRLRKSGNKLRYYAVGEYGSKTYRPHYHILLFGDVPESQIRAAWTLPGTNIPIGIVHIGDVTTQSIAYCTKYVINQRVSEMRHDRNPPFSVMSRRPAIGHNYLTKEMVEWHRSDLRNYVLIDGAKRHLPRYYKQKIFTKRQQYVIAHKAQREILAALRKELLELGKHHRNPIEYREQKFMRLAKTIKNKSNQNLTI